jgi:hypothetical protein
VHRIEPPRKIQLFEKRADAESNSTYKGSTMRITSGGGVAYDDRAAAAAGIEQVRRDRNNLLGNLDGESNIGPTEMEFHVQLPSCHEMRTKDKDEHIHFDTTYHCIQVHHWIKIVLRLSKPDPSDSTKRRHFEISIDSPFHILSCQATPANIALPAYTSPECASIVQEQFECGCPGAPRRPNFFGTQSLLTTAGLRAQANSLPGNSSTTSIDSVPNLARPAPAHIPLHPSNLNDPNSSQANLSRPIHLLRNPSFNPPSFSDATDDPPPSLVTPPPRYETLGVGGDGLADYFARLADEYSDEDGEEGRDGRRVDMPLTPGGRVNRSMDAVRGWAPVGR